MNSEVKPYCQFCPLCRTYYIVAIGQSCRCPVQKTESEAKEKLLSEWEHGDVTL